MQNIEVIDDPTTMAEVDALITELEAQFGEERMMPEAKYPPPTNAGCTVVASCAC